MIKIKEYEKDLRPYNATRYSLYGNRRSSQQNEVRCGAFAFVRVRARKAQGLI